MVSIDMRVPKLYYKLLGFCVGETADDVGKEGIGGDVEGDAEAEVGGSLEHKAREAGFRGCRCIFGRKGYVELAEEMTGW